MARKVFSHRHDIRSAREAERARRKAHNDRIQLNRAVEKMHGSYPPRARIGSLLRAQVIVAINTRQIITMSYIGEIGSSCFVPLVERVKPRGIKRYELARGYVFNLIVA